MPRSPLNDLKPLGRISWTKLFRAWERREAKQPGWIRHYRERGYPSWRAWRTKVYAKLRPGKRPWTLYAVPHPERSVPTWFGGPFKGWRKHYRGRSVTFRTLAGRRSIQTNGKVLSLIRRFPTSTQMLGASWRGRLVVIEGMHRAAAIALANRKRRRLNTKITIAIAPVSGRLPNLSSGYARRRS